MARLERGGNQSGNGRAYSWLIYNVPKQLSNKIKEHLFKVPKFKKIRPVWTGFKIAVRHKLLTHYKTRLYTAYKKAIVDIIALL